MSETLFLRVAEIVKETSDAITIHFEQPEKPVSYLSGQYLTLICDIDGKEERRCYSLCSASCADRFLSVTVKRVEGGKVSNYLIDNLKPGDTLSALPPMGNFYFVRKEESKEAVMIGGGSGITPLFSMIKSILSEEPHVRVNLLYVNSSRDNTIFYTELEEWRARYSERFRIVYYWSEDWKEKEHKSGFFSRLFKKKEDHRLNESRLISVLDEWGIQRGNKAEFYVCGPQGLMDMVVRTLHGLGYNEETIHKESFYTELDTSAVAASDTEYVITVRYKGKDYEVKVPAGTSILEAGLDQGFDLAYSCQNGDCGSCISRCLSGTVTMLTTEALSERELKEGYILPCVGYPQSDDVVVEFR